MTYASMKQVAPAHGSSSANANRIFAVAMLLLVFGVTGCNKLKARDLLNKGVASLKNGQYDAAIEDFKEARDLDPTLLNARLYLATAYASQYIPGAPSEENIRHGNEAIAEFKGVLEKDPKNLSAIDGIGSILFQMGGQPFDPKKFEESQMYHQKHTEIKPQDPKPNSGSESSTGPWLSAGTLNCALNTIAKTSKSQLRIPIRCLPRCARNTCRNMGRALTRASVI